MTNGNPSGMKIFSYSIVVLTLILGSSRVVFAQAAETQPTPETTPAATQQPSPIEAVGQPVFLDQKPTDDEVAKENDRYIRLTREMEKAQKTKTDEDTLKLLNQELEARQTELGQIQKDLSQTVKKKTEDNENLRLLITLYESMKADEVAALLKKMPLQMSVTVVKMMNPKKASKVISAMDPSMAAQVSRLLVQIPQPQSQVASKGANP
jgi:flagellar motility protein MotE (MotC chaperone)